MAVQDHGSIPRPTFGDRPGQPALVCPVGWLHAGTSREALHSSLLSEGRASHSEQSLPEWTGRCPSRHVGCPLQGVPSREHESPTWVGLRRLHLPELPAFVPSSSSEVLSEDPSAAAHMLRLLTLENARLHFLNG